LEKRYTKEHVAIMLAAAGLEDIRFSDSDPYWVCKATKPLGSNFPGWIDPPPAMESTVSIAR
jgi:hypothetical protein